MVVRDVKALIEAEVSGETQRSLTCRLPCPRPIRLCLPMPV